MRAGERIVQALEALPSASVNDIARSSGGVSNGREGASGANVTSDHNHVAASDHDSLGDFAYYPGAAAPTLWDAARAEEEAETASRTSAFESVDEAVTMPGGSPVKFSAPTLNFAIKELGERGDFERAHALYLWMTMQGTTKKNRSGENAKVRSIHWSPYDRVGDVDADP